MKLPPLPEGFKSYEFPYGGYDEDEMRTYARAAIEADRKRRGEPVAWRVHPFDYGVGYEGVYALTSRPDQAAAWERKGWEVQPLFTAPQSADPLAWQPISTAPHETELLLGWEEWDGAWRTDVSMATWGWRKGTVSRMSQHGQATHWMPLPAPATKAQRQEERE